MMKDTMMQDAATGDLAALERAAAEATERAAEAQAAQARLAAAREAARAEERGPLLAERAALGAEVEALEAEIRGYLTECLAGGRPFYERLCDLAFRCEALRTRRQAVEQITVHDGVRVPPGFVAFVYDRLRRFDAEGNSGAGPAWGREGGR